MEPQQPSVGRIVHYVLPEGSRWAGEHRAAAIAQVHTPLSPPGSTGMCNLSVFKGQTTDFDAGFGGAFAGRDAGSAVALVGSVNYSATAEPNTWHWPERA